MPWSGPPWHQQFFPSRLGENTIFIYYIYLIYLYIWSNRNCSNSANTWGKTKPPEPKKCQTLHHYGCTARADFQLLRWTLSVRVWVCVLVKSQSVVGSPRLWLLPWHIKCCSAQKHVAVLHWVKTAAHEWHTYTHNCHHDSNGSILTAYFVALLCEDYSNWQLKRSHSVFSPNKGVLFKSIQYLD